MKIHKITLKNIEKIGQEIRKQLQPNTILSITGELGAGKTTLIKHLVPEQKVSSPSFLHALLYGDNFAHIDAYTFKSKEAFFALGIEEMLETRCVIIEWGDLTEDLFNFFECKIIKINLKKINENEREISIEE